MNLTFDQAAILIGSQRASSAAVAHRLVESTSRGATVEEDTCRVCSQPKPIGDLVQSSRNPRGYVRICKPCERLRSKDYHARTLTRHIWRSMMARCYNENDTRYGRYGGSGITVWEPWHEFARFRADVGERPSLEYSIDRFPNNDGNYEPGNVRWATWEEQNRNRGDFNTLITAFNESLTAPEWAERTGIESETIRRRIDAYGFTPERALTEPVKTNGTPCLITFQDKTQRRAAWAHEMNVKPRRLESLLTKYSVEEAFRIAAKEGKCP